jgi:hypothetical protein
LKASRKKSKPRATAKAKAKPKKAKGTKARAKTKAKRDVDSLIKHLNVSSLKNEDITTILAHCSATLDLRKAVDDADASLTESSADFCYTKAGDDPIVSIRSGGFKVGEMLETEAQARGIKPCG